jgi:hypothetical protein
MSDIAPASPQSSGLRKPAKNGRDRGRSALSNDAMFKLLGRKPAVAAAAKGRTVAAPCGRHSLLAAGRAHPDGGDDGTVAATDADGAVSTLATDGKRRWIDHGERPGSGIRLVSRLAILKAPRRTSAGTPSTVGGLAFAPKGLLTAHYGVTLWFPNARNEPEMLAWKGSHLAVTFSPDARFLVSSMQEPMLHGWRLSDRKDMRMSGYTARVRSLDFTADGKLLATSGANQLVLWPFQGKDGPMGKVPRMFAPAEFQIGRSPATRARISSRPDMAMA